MARKITIPITDHDNHCSTGYTVAYKTAGDTYWTERPYTIPPFEINNLLDDTLYDFRITRSCCDGVVSTPLELSINTTLLDTPANFVATPGDTEVVLDWDDVTNAQNYIVERADDAAFTVNLVEVYENSTRSYTDTGLTNDQAYYFRVRATAPYHMDSDYATVNATPTI